MIGSGDMQPNMVAVNVVGSGAAGVFLGIDGGGSSSSSNSHSSSPPISHHQHPESPPPPSRRNLEPIVSVLGGIACGIILITVLLLVAIR
jgi:hypothetical protein